MEPKPAIEVKGLGKRYIVEHEGRALMRHLYMRLLRRRRAHEFWALRGVDFSVEPGRSLGVIGHNGAGKSTLLTVLAGVTEPTEGSVAIPGRIGAIVELGAGFHPNLTGRDNIFFNGSVLGFTREEMRERYESILAFAELGDFIDAPVRTYSSGMLARLGFAVASHLDPDVLLIDEVLAVGDESFQRKCIKKMEEFRQRGVTLVFVSHSLRQVKKICDHVLVLERSRIVASETPEVAIGLYLSGLGQRAEAERRELRKRVEGGRYGSAEVSIESVRIMDAAGRESASFEQGDTLRVEIDYEATKTVEEGSASIVIWSGAEEAVVYGINTRADGHGFFRLAGRGRLAVTLPRLKLVRGRYEISVGLNRGFGEVLDQHHRLYSFELLADRDELGMVSLEHHWEL